MCIKKILKKLKYTFFEDKRIALIRLEGIIADTSALPVASKISEAIDKVQEKEIKALILRINSPGGTVGASQELFDKIKKLKDHGVKVVVSMGDVAASGGLYIAVAADKIVANPGTVTGSIGVIIKAGILKELYKKIGLEHDIVKSGKFKDILSDLKHMSKEDQEILQEMVDDTYYQFITAISTERKINIEDVKKFADGRVFTGNQAKQLGIVDETGSLKDAENLAKKLAGIEGEPDIIEIEPQKSFFQKISKLSLDQVLNGVSFNSIYSNIPLWILKR
ncbi:MAG: signal peptide peptidase SppA [Candidatus Gastranaerophilaceae bacterium]|jgi:protease-4